MHLAEVLAHGGLETQILTLCRELKRLGHEPYVSAKAMSVEFRQQLDELCVEHLVDPSPGEQLVPFIKDRDIQVLHAHPTAIPMAVIIGRTLGLPVVATYHGFFGWSWDMHAVLAKLICISRQVYDQVKNDPNLAGKLLVIQNGIDTDIFKPARSPGDGRKILFIGRLDADKYYSLKIIIEALAAIPGVELLVAGPGAYYDRLKAEAPSWVRYLGFVRDMPSLINEADIVIGTGRGVREAMACGVPVIALDACGYDGLVSPETIDILEYGNFMGRSGRPLNADNLLQDLGRVIDHPETRAAIGEWSRKYAAENYAITSVALKHLLVYKEVTGFRGDRF